MNYLVMECGFSYAIVLDHEGRFLKVPNLGYEVGQSLDSVVTWNELPKRNSLRRRMSMLAAAAACLCLMAVGGWQFWSSPIGTVRMQINPDVEMSVNQLDRVIGVKGLNDDGSDLIAGYRAHGKKIDAVSDELADRAMEMGYLKDGGQITLTVESDREAWKVATEDMLVLELEIHLEHAVQITAAPKPSPEPQPPAPIVIDPETIPVPPRDDNRDDDWDDDREASEKDDDWNDRDDLDDWDDGPDDIHDDPDDFADDWDDDDSDDFGGDDSWDDDSDDFRDDDWDDDDSDDDSWDDDDDDDD